MLQGLIEIAPTFTPWASLGGGVLIGVASTLHLGLAGRITGLSGIWRTAIVEPAGQRWKYTFLGGFLGGGAHLGAFHPEVFGPSLLTIAPLPVIAAAGTLVGVGTFMGSGCTSGHGVCGLPRLSPRSLVAVSTFMSTGVMTAHAATHWEPLTQFVRNTAESNHANVDTIEALSLISAFSPAVTAAVAAGLITVPLLKRVKRPAGTPVPPADRTVSLLASAVAGFTFAEGLGLSGMSDPSKVLGFLDIFSATGWDPSLMLVMGGAVGFNLPLWRAILKRKPLLDGHVCMVPDRKDITPSLVVGSATFGVGWGLAGLCPGPGILGLASSTSGAAFAAWVAAFSVGQRVASAAFQSAHPSSQPPACSSNENASGDTNL